MKEKNEIKLTTQWRALWIAIMICFLCGQATSLMAKSETGQGYCTQELADFPVAAGDADSASAEESESLEEDLVEYASLVMYLGHEFTPVYQVAQLEISISTQLDQHTPPPESL